MCDLDAEQHQKKNVIVIADGDEKRQGIKFFDQIFQFILRAPLNVGRAVNCQPGYRGILVEQTQIVKLNSFIIHYIWF